VRLLVLVVGACVLLRALHAFMTPFCMTKGGFALSALLLLFTSHSLSLSLSLSLLTLCRQTYVGEILVAMNPFKKIAGIYDNVKMVEYDSIGDRSSRPPHIFAVSDSAFATMCANPPGRAANQVR
jgi:hypothetical protein